MPYRKFISGVCGTLKVCDGFSVLYGKSFTGELCIKAYVQHFDGILGVTNIYVCYMSLNHCYI